MSRRKRAAKRPLRQEIVYRSRLASMIVSRILKNGKKSLASRLFYQAMGKVRVKVKKIPCQYSIKLFCTQLPELY